MDYASGGHIIPRGLRSTFGLPPIDDDWPFGTIVRRKPMMLEPDLRLLALSDEGETFTAVVVHSEAPSWPLGMISDRWTKAVWEPDR